GLPIEFQLAGFAPDDWHPEVCLNRMAAFSMTGNAVGELEHAEVLTDFGATKAAKLFDFDPAVDLDPAPGLDLKGLSPALLKNLVGSDRRIEFPARARGKQQLDHLGLAHCQRQAFAGERSSPRHRPACTALHGAPRCSRMECDRSGRAGIAGSRARTQ